MGGGFRTAQPTGAGRGHHLCPCRGTGTDGPAGSAQGRPGRVRRHSHVGNSGLSLRHTVGRAGAVLSSKSHPARRGGVPAVGSADTCGDYGSSLSTGAGQRGAGRPARGPIQRGSCSGTLTGPGRPPQAITSSRKSSSADQERRSALALYSMPEALSFAAGLVKA